MLLTIGGAIVTGGTSMWVTITVGGIKTIATDNSYFIRDYIITNNITGDVHEFKVAYKAAGDLSMVIDKIS